MSSLIRTLLKGLSLQTTHLSSRRMVALPAASTSQNVTLPDIPELFNENFLDILLPKKSGQADSASTLASTTVVEPPKNALIDALAGTANRTLTENLATALKSTLSPVPDAFNNVNQGADGRTITKHLNEAWAEDTRLTLRIIWCLRSIPDGKGSKEAFYRAFGWLLKNHPRTAIENLPLLVKPVSWKPKKKVNVPHGYWKDLLNIVAMAATDELSPNVQVSAFLHTPKEPYTYPRSKGDKVKEGTAEDRIAAHLAANAKCAEAARAVRAEKLNEAHQRLTAKLSDPTFRALYIAVARLFAAELSKDLSVLKEISKLPQGKSPVSLLKTMSLAGKWAPTPGLSHDRVTNLSSAISLLLVPSEVGESLPKALDNQALGVRDRFLILRSYYQRWLLRPLREAIQCPEPHMSAKRWDQIRYNRVPSICMKNCTELFFTHDPKRFEEYLVKVEEGKKSISGATLMPHELVASILTDGVLVNGVQVETRNAKYPALQEVKKKAAEMRYRVAESQWKALVDNLRASGSLDNTLAVCDVSGSMGSMHSKSSRNSPQPIQAAVALSLILASLAKPPFNGGFITFSSNPQYVKLDLDKNSVYDTVNDMIKADWGYNTDFNAVFLKLLLPLAQKHGLKQEDMVKRLFVFSDMQFDVASSGRRTGTAGDWDTNYDIIEQEYKEAGYEVPQIVYWDLSAQGPRTVEALADRKGVAMLNGFSPALLKVFMGEQEEGEDGWEKVEGAKEDEFNPLNVMKKALMRKSFDGLVVID
ncbi:hypothetical protein BKA70DRAFT_1272437 [Coprinopsis sp. MPI-PUGE-AT-0042]|nr:hypothetical protein BKA70DRAFT_1272437 [Coprinopsis sp. MPI-PUGE-AT-0042]